MTTRPWMPMWVGDYRADTAHLGAIEHGAYLLLIMHYWTAGGLPQDEAALARIACMTPAEWRKHRPVISAFFQDGWKHKRVDQELAEADRLSNAGRVGGLASGAARRAKKANGGTNDGGNDRSTVDERSDERSMNDRSTIREPLQPQSQRKKKGRQTERAHAHALPDGFTLDEADKYAAREAGWDARKTDLELVKFRDHAKAKGRKQADWHAAWRNWVRSPYQTPTGPPPQRRDTGGGYATVLEELRGQQNGQRSYTADQLFDPGDGRTVDHDPDLFGSSDVVPGGDRAPRGLDRDDEAS